VEVQGQAFVPPILDDSEQEHSDLDPVEGEDDFEEDDEEEEPQSGSEGDGSGDYEQEEQEQEEEEEEGDHSDGSSEGGLAADIYRPSPGEDIYGRPVPSSAAEGGGGKYIPPARRQQAAQPSHAVSSAIDEVSPSRTLSVSLYSSL
jgi:hypothetical protein